MESVVTGHKKKHGPNRSCFIAPYPPRISGMRLPKVFAVERHGAGTIGRAVIQQTAVHDEPPVGSIETEAEAVRREIIIQMQRAPVPLPTSELVETFLQGFVVERFGVFPRFAEPLFAFDYHREWILGDATKSDPHRRAALIYKLNMSTASSGISRSSPCRRGCRGSRAARCRRDASSPGPACAS